LRVEIGRLRTALRRLAGVSATKRGFALVPRRAREIVVLARPVEEQHAAVLAFLADGESWSSSALALALDASQRTVQRALDQLAAAGKVQSYGRARARRWTTPPVPGFTTTLLLPGSAAERLKSALTVVDMENGDSPCDFATRLQRR
jgi:DNA-binding transcriptional ArsR family regulator